MQLSMLIIVNATSLPLIDPYLENGIVHACENDSISYDDEGHQNSLQSNYLSHFEWNSA